MCVSLPVKIVKKSGRKIFAQTGSKKIEVSDALVSVKQGDYVYLRSSLIVGKINKREAEQAIILIKGSL